MKAVLFVAAALFLINFVTHCMSAAETEDRERAAFIAKLEAEAEEYRITHAALKRCMQEGFDRYGRRYPGHLRLTLMTKGEQRAYHAHSAHSQACWKKY